MVIWPVSPRSISPPARRLRSGVGSARCSTRTRSRSRSLLDFANSRLPALLFVYVQVEIHIDVAKRAHGRPQACASSVLRRLSGGPDRARAMRGAISFAVERPRSAKEEAGGRGIPHRPTAGAAIQLQQRAPLRMRHIGIEP